MATNDAVKECLKKEIEWLNTKRQRENDELREKYEKKIKRLKQTAERVETEAAQKGWSPCRGSWASDAELTIGSHYMEQRLEELLLQCPRDHFIVFWKNSVVGEDCFTELLQKYSKRKEESLYLYKSYILVDLAVKVTSSSYEPFDPDYDQIVDFHVQQRSLPCFDVPLPAHFEADKKPIDDEYVISSCWQTQNPCFEGEMPGTKSLFIMPTVGDFQRFLDSDIHDPFFSAEDVRFDPKYECYTATSKQPAIIVSRKPTCKLEPYTL